MAKSKTIYCCSECGNETANWSGKCPSCGSWNSLREVKIELKTYAKNISAQNNPKPRKLKDLEITGETRFSTGISELDRVLGGGAVVGSLVLVGGAPGIGKSTLLLQMCGHAGVYNNVLYVSGEESDSQIRMRADRLKVSRDDLLVYTETDIDRILFQLDEITPDLVIIDSIQTICDEAISAAPGSPSQIRECTMRILRATKEKGCTVFLVGHITKDGTLAGPKILEHMVDCVLYFEGERETDFRILRAAKNRFGSTNEIGVFEMGENGIRSVENPSEILLSGRPVSSPGTCVTCVMEGSRPILAEVQALVSQTGNNAARRCNGIDYNRSAMLIAVLEKRGGLPVVRCDTYINVVGGLTIDEPAADLATLLAMASSYLDRALGADLAALGEVGLSGELRQVSAINQRLSEIARLGFSRCIIPAIAKDSIQIKTNLQIIPVKDIRQAIASVLKKEN